MTWLPRAPLAALLLVCAIAPSGASASPEGRLSRLFGRLFRREPLKELLLSRTRPTMRQLLDARTQKIQSPKNLYPDTLINDAGGRNRINAINETLPKAIALLEYSFPGAIWAPLGRDAVIFGDALDAFYISIGQPGRVSRLNASTSSFFGASQDDIVRFLREAGLNFDLQKGRPFVGLDRTNFNVNSQSTQLVRAGYSAFSKGGGNPENLIRHFNFVGLRSNPDKTTMSQEAIEDYFANARIEGTPEPVLSKVMQLYVYGWTDSLAWHESFDTLGVQANGAFEGAPGINAHLEHRQAIITHMLEIYQAVSAPAFLEKVQAEAKKLGYEFPSNEADFVRMRQQMSERIRSRAHGFPVEAVTSFKQLISTEVKPLLKVGVEPIAPKNYKKNDYGYDYDYNRYDYDLGSSYDRQMRQYQNRVKQRNDEAFANADRIETWFASKAATLESLSVQHPQALSTYTRGHLSLYLMGELTRLLEQDVIEQRGFERLLAICLGTLDPSPAILRRLRRLYESSPTLRSSLDSIRGFLFDESPASGVRPTDPLSKNFEPTKNYAIVRDAIIRPSGCANVFAGVADPSAEPAAPPQDPQEPAA